MVWGTYFQKHCPSSNEHLLVFGFWPKHLSRWFGAIQVQIDICLFWGLARMNCVTLVPLNRLKSKGGNAQIHPTIFQMYFPYFASSFDKSRIMHKSSWGRSYSVSHRIGPKYNCFEIMFAEKSSSLYPFRHLWGSLAAL